MVGDLAKLVAWSRNSVGLRSKRQVRTTNGNVRFVRNIRKPDASAFRLIAGVSTTSRSLTRSLVVPYSTVGFRLAKTKLVSDAHARFAQDAKTPRIQECHEAPAKNTDFLSYFASSRETSIKSTPRTTPNRRSALRSESSSLEDLQSSRNESRKLVIRTDSRLANGSPYFVPMLQPQYRARSRMSSRVVGNS